MITAGEIRKKSEAKYLEVLVSSLKGENCFPLVIRSDKALSKDFIQMSKEIAEVFSASKERRGFGYSVISEPVKTRLHGIQDIPKSIKFESQLDYLKFLNKEKEYRMMMENFNFIKSELHLLDSWVKQNPKAIIDNSDIWPELLKVCQWFLHSFEPSKYYIRELPITVHTKFIEENRAVLRMLLDELIPDAIVSSENQFEKRYSLKFDQPLVRFRPLDRNCWKIQQYDDLSVPIEQFSKNPIDCAKVYIIENKMNFLTFPQLPNSIAVWGQGYAVESLKIIDWFQQKEIFYWSDLDVQGFQMLSQVRSYFPQTQSFLMDINILEKYREFVTKGTLSNISLLPNLTKKEKEAFDFLKMNNFRLEQERISQSDLFLSIPQIIPYSR